MYVKFTHLTPEWLAILLQVFSKDPSPSILVVRTSPSLRNLPSITPTPPGVPVKITSPTFKVTISDK